MRRILALVLAVASSVVPAVAQDARGAGDARLDALAQQYFAEQWRLNPIGATQAGVHFLRNVQP